MLQGQDAGLVYEIDTLQLENEAHLVFVHEMDKQAAQLSGVLT